MDRYAAEINEFSRCAGILNTRMGTMYKGDYERLAKVMNDARDTSEAFRRLGLAALAWSLVGFPCLIAAIWLLRPVYVREVENVGRRAGDEVVQLYIRAAAAGVTRPVKELKGFERVTLRPGERRRVEFTLTPGQLGCYNRALRFVVEPGTFKVTAGTSSVGGLEATFEVVEK